MRDTIYYGQPINWKNPLNRGLLFWHLVLPWYMGSKRWPNLKRHFRTSINSGGQWTNKCGPREGYGSIFFDGVNDHAQNNNSQDGGSTTWTISAWICPLTVNAAWHNILGLQDDSTNRNFLLSIAGGAPATADRIALLVRSGGSDVVVESASSATVGQWYHLVGTNTGDSGTLSLYINGELEDSQASVTPTTGTRAFAIGNAISALNPVAGEYFHGHVDDVCFWNSRCLDATEVRQLYKDSKTGYRQRLNRLLAPARTPEVTTVFDPATLIHLPAQLPVRRPIEVLPY